MAIAIRAGCRMHLLDLLGRIMAVRPHDTYGRLRVPHLRPSPRRARGPVSQACTKPANGRCERAVPTRAVRVRGAERRGRRDLRAMCAGGAGVRARINPAPPHGGSRRRRGAVIDLGRTAGLRPAGYEPPQASASAGFRGHHQFALCPPELPKSDQPHIPLDPLGIRTAAAPRSLRRQDPATPAGRSRRTPNPAADGMPGRLRCTAGMEDPRVVGRPRVVRSTLGVKPLTAAGQPSPARTRQVILHRRLTKG